MCPHDFIIALLSNQSACFKFCQQIIAKYSTNEFVYITVPYTKMK